MRRGLLIAVILFAVPSLAHAATMFLSPAAGSYGTGRSFVVTVKMDTQGAAINAAEGALSFDPARLQVVSVSTDGSVFNLSVQDPVFSNTAGTITWAGVILNPGYTGSSGTLLTVTFRGVAAGPAAVKFAAGAVLANDGKGTNVLNGMTGGAYTIGAGTTPSPGPTVPPSTGAPAVTSTTHPDERSWYANNDPEFAWPLPEGVDGVSYLVNPKRDANPGNRSDGLVNSASFTDVAEGSSYFHVKFRRGGQWGPITHFPFRVDTRLPEPFAVTRADAGDPTEPQPQVVYITTDEGSGVATYRMRIGAGEWFEVPEAPPSSPYTLPLQAPGEHMITVEALDRAGNASRATHILRVESIPSPRIISWPAEVDEAMPFELAGTAEPGHRVLVSGLRTGLRGIASDAETQSREAVADTDGRWSVLMPGYEDGVWQFVAYAVDDRGAVSYPSNTVDVRVGSGFFGWLRGFIAGIPSWLWLLLALLIAGALLFFLGRRFFPVAARTRDTAAPDKLERLIQDIDAEIAQLDRTAKHRPLYPEEKYLRSKLKSYRSEIVSVRKGMDRQLAKRKGTR